MIMPNTWIHLGSTVLRAPRPRVIAIPLTDISYVSCKKYEYKTIDHMDYKIYLSSSKKTYAVTTDTGKTIDVSSLINAEYFRQQKIAL